MFVSCHEIMTKEIAQNQIHVGKEAWTYLKTDNNLKMKLNTGAGE